MYRPELPDLYRSISPKRCPISIRPPVVVYMKGYDDLREFKIIEAISRGFGIKSQLKIASLDFINNLQNKLGLEFVTFPLVFFRDRYIGGLNEFQHLKDDGQLEAPAPLATSYFPDGVCLTCGGHKFTLHDINKLFTCKACYGSGVSNHSIIRQREIVSIRHKELFICFEGKDSQQRHIYVICSLDALRPKIFTTEAVIYGYASMGCGVYDSRIVLAGGQLRVHSTLHHTTLHNGCITFDMNNRSVNHKPFLPMTHGKYKPLVFQLGKRLYVCDSRYESTGTPFLEIEFYSPAMKTTWNAIAGIFESVQELLTHSCLVFGNTCFMSYPSGGHTWTTHSNYLQNSWTPLFDKPLPFTGVATFHSQDGFDDFVMIYLDKGDVRVCKFDFSCFGDSQCLFSLIPCMSHEDEPYKQGYFADFGEGCFCLTAFGQLGILVCTFVVTRVGTPSGPLEVTCSFESTCNFYYHDLNNFVSDGTIITSVVGCFVRTQNEEAKSRAEKAAAIFYKCFRKMEDDYDLSQLKYMENPESLILEDIWGSGEEDLSSDDESEEDLACDDECEDQMGEETFDDYDPWQLENKDKS